MERFAAAFLQFFLQEGHVGCGLHEGIADGIGMLDDEVQVFLSFSVKGDRFIGVCGKFRLFWFLISRLSAWCR